MPEDLAHLAEWVGRTETARDIVAPFPPHALAATLDIESPLPADGALPPGWHWLYCLSAPFASTLGDDGHAKRGGFLPPVPLPRRMYAGGRMRFHRPLIVGTALTRESRIASVTPKQGRSGNLVFVTVEHQVNDSTGLLVEESQDLVYRDVVPYVEADPIPAGHAPQWTRGITPDPVLLFRFSALTFNSPRIHYARPYVTGVEGSPGLLVHGPLTATLLLNLACRSLPGAVVETFTFRATAPLFDTAPFTIAGRPNDRGADLWALTPRGGMAMTASVTLRA